MTCWTLLRVLACVVVIAAGCSPERAETSDPADSAATGDGGKTRAEQNCKVWTCPVSVDPCLERACGPEGCTFAPTQDGKECQAAASEAKCRHGECRAGRCEQVHDPDGSACYGGPSLPLCERWQCAAGTCVAAADPGGACALTGAQSPCIEGRCNPSLACIPTPVADGTACADGDPCSGQPACLGGSCVAGVDLCQCKTDSDCNALFSAGWLACNGPQICIVDPELGGKRRCVGDPSWVQPCEKIDEPCRVRQCNEQTGGCEWLPKPDNTPCDDGSPCTQGDACSAGTCEAGVMLCECTTENAAQVCETKYAGTKNACTGDWSCANPDAGPFTAAASAAEKQSKTHCAFDPATIPDCAAQIGDPACADPVCVVVDDQALCTLVPTPDAPGCDVVDAGVIDAGAPDAGSTVPDAVAAADADAVADAAADTAADGDTATDTAPTPEPTWPACKLDSDCPATAKPCFAARCQQGQCAVVADDLATCDDGPCTEPGFCSGGYCVNQPATCFCSKDADCAAQDDGNPCNGELMCQGGFCLAKPPGEVVCPDDGKPCLTSVCDLKSGNCVPVPENGLPCSDGNPCTSSDHCASGACIGSGSCGCTTNADCTAAALGKALDLCAPVLVCDAVSKSCVPAPGKQVLCPADDNPCTQERCDSATGACVSEPQVGPCEDGNPCTPNDSCDKGVCVAGKGQICSCSKDADCAPLQTNACTHPLVCQGGGCVVSSKGPAPCPDKDGNSCTVPTCDSKIGGCVELPSTTAKCDDGDPCTPSSCTAGACKSGPNACTCTKHEDCAAQEDGNLCNGTLQCDKDNEPWKCVVAPTTVVDCSGVPKKACQVALCEPKTGACVVSDLPDGTACDDGQPCTLSTCNKTLCVSKPGGEAGCPCSSHDACSADPCEGVAYCDGKSGICKVDARFAVTCDDKDDTACKAAQCTAGGVCKLLPRKDGSPCKDGEVCTTPDTCKGGSCSSGPNVCGCATDADCAAGDDGNPCNGVVRCDKSSFPPSCKLDPASIVTCEGPAPTCHLRACNAKTGACEDVPAPNGQGCSDGHPCTANDTCDKGTCKSGLSVCECLQDSDCTSDACFAQTCQAGSGGKAPWTCVKSKNEKDCPDNGPCQLGACDPKKGCVLLPAPNGTACEDGQSCTIADSCVGGACKAGKQGCGCTSHQDCQVPGEVLPCGTRLCQDGTCVLVGKNVGKICDDGDMCTPNSACNTQGLCSAVFADSPPCNADGSCPTLGTSCDPASKKCHVDICACKVDADCANKEDGDACNGTMYCNVATGSCEVDPATAVLCDPSKDTPCITNICHPKLGVCKPTPSEFIFTELIFDWKTGTAITKKVPYPVKKTSVFCDDGDLCTPVDECSEGACVADTINVCKCAKDADCAKLEDGNLCNGTLYCDVATNQCKVAPQTVVHCATEAELGPCWAYTCDPKTGTCALVPKPKQTNPAPAGSCVPYTSCKLGIELPGPDLCFCHQDADCAAKDDGNPCTGTLRCTVDGKCAADPSTIPLCALQDDGCGARCDPKSGACTLPPPKDGSPCPGGIISAANPCGGDAICSSGTCVAKPGQCCKTVADCAAKSAALETCGGTPTCTPVKDGLASICGVQSGTGNSCPQPKGPCWQAVCNAATGACSEQALPAGTSCGAATSCAAAPLCDGKGVCAAAAPLPKGKSCDDGSCKEGQSCDGAGTCAGGTSTAKLTCAFDSDCPGKPNDNLCAATIVCAHKSKCESACVLDPKTAVTCADVDAGPCHDAACAPKTGDCVPKQKADGSACGVGKVCKAGLCVAP